MTSGLPACPSRMALDKAARDWQKGEATAPRARAQWKAQDSGRGHSLVGCSERLGKFASTNDRAKVKRDRQSEEKSITATLKKGRVFGHGTAG